MDAETLYILKGVVARVLQQMAQLVRSGHHPELNSVYGSLLFIQHVLFNSKKDEHRG